MKPILRFLFTGMFLLSLLSSCLQSSSQSVLPDTWPDDMVLKMTYGGGMRYYSSTIEIKSNGAYQLINDQGNEIRTPLSFTQQELNDLLSFLKARQFELIKSDMRAGIIYDKGTTSTLLSWNKRVLGYSDGSSTTIAEEYKKQYYEVQNYLGQLVARKTKR